MKKIKFLLAAFFLASAVSSCGYSTSSLLPASIKNINIPAFKNKITYTTDGTHGLYIPLLEVKAHNAVVDRFVFNGRLRIKDKEQADLILKGNLINYEREALRYTDTNDVQEYRIRVTVSLELWDPHLEKMLWSEPSFAGEATYFLTGPGAKTEDAALQDALVDLARRVAERVLEDW